MRLQNADIRQSAEKAGIKLWEIADVLNINDGNFSRKLRKELPIEEKIQIMSIIEKLSDQEAE